jgi:hypothetical protein
MKLFEKLRRRREERTKDDKGARTGAELSDVERFVLRIEAKREAERRFGPRARDPLGLSAYPIQTHPLGAPPDDFGTAYRPPRRQEDDPSGEAHDSQPAARLAA